MEGDEFVDVPLEEIQREHRELELQAKQKKAIVEASKRKLQELELVEDELRLLQYKMKRKLKELKVSI